MVVFHFLVRGVLVSSLLGRVSLVGEFFPFTPLYPVLISTPIFAPDISLKREKTCPLCLEVIDFYTVGLGARLVEVEMSVGKILSVIAYPRCRGDNLVYHIAPETSHVESIKGVVGVYFGENIAPLRCKCGKRGEAPPVG